MNIFISIIYISIFSTFTLTHTKMTWLKTVPKTATFTKYMPADPAVPTIEAAEEVPKQLQRKARLVKGAFTWVKPEQRDVYNLRWVSPAALETLDIPVSDTLEKIFEDTVAGQHVFTSQDLYPWAQNYAGYQFGNWAGQLGDGRAISLFEVKNSKTDIRYEIQLKGAGLTPYSRFADGLAVLRSSIREALASETLHAIGIPTTRVLALTDLPETKARRERTETCAIVARFAESWVRIGTFDLYHSRNDRENLRKLADYCIDEVLRLDKGVATADQNRYYHLFREITIRNCKMIAKCQAYGFLNGVLNTDNTSVLGLSMDYGPFAFMDNFDFSFTPNHDDGELRYNYRNTPTMIWWNCVRLGEALGELMGTANVDDADFIENGTTDKEARRAVSERATKLIMDMGEEYQDLYKSEFTSILCSRLGLLTVKDEDYDELISPLLEMMEKCELDYNSFFRKLGNTAFFNGTSTSGSVFLPKVRSQFPSTEDATQAIEDWLVHYAARLEAERNIDDAERKSRMNKVNPNFILKNWVLQDVISNAQAGDWAPFNAVAKMALSPFESSWDTGYENYLDETPQEARGITCSCSS